VQLLPEQLGGEEGLRVPRVGADTGGYRGDQLLEGPPPGELLGGQVLGHGQLVGEHHLVVTLVRQPEIAVGQAPGPHLLAGIRALVPRVFLELDQFTEAAVGDGQDQ
jgi:hypothetical protein